MKNIIIILLLLISFHFFASEELPDMYETDLNFAQVVQAKVVQPEDNTWYFSVTVRHQDDGWNHYADKWVIIEPESGEILGERVLLHPHVSEQPFTRSLGSVTIPPEVTVVIIRAKCNKHGYGGKEILVDFTIPETDDYTIITASSEL